VTLPKNDASGQACESISVIWAELTISFGLRSAVVKVKRRRSDGWSGAGAQRQRRAADGSAPLLRPQNPAHDERARSACRADERSTVKRSARWSGRTPSLLLLSSFGTRRSVAAFALHVQAAMTETQFSKQGEIRALMNDIRLK